MSGGRPAHRPRPLRAALLGLALGCAIGGLWLLGQGALAAWQREVCDEQDLDCHLEASLVREGAGRQLGIGGALCLLSIGLLLLRREDGDDAGATTDDEARDDGGSGGE